MQNGDVTKVRYPKSLLRPKIDYRVLSHLSDTDKTQLGLALLGRKARSWQFEQEYRIFVPLVNGRVVKRDGMYWHRIPKRMLVAVVPGIRCPIDDEKFRKVLKDNGFLTRK